MSRRLFRGFVVVLLASVLLPLVLFDETKPFVDRFGNHASVLGFLLSVVGFALTVWTVLETMRVSRESQEQVRKEIERSRRETVGLLAKIRLGSLKEICDQAFYLISAAREAVSDGSWRRVVEKFREATAQVHRIVGYPDLEPNEVASLRVAGEEISATIAFVERNRLNKPNASKSLPDEQTRPIDQLFLAINAVRSRLMQSLYEVPHAGDRANP